MATTEKPLHKGRHGWMVQPRTAAPDALTPSHLSRAARDHCTFSPAHRDRHAVLLFPSARAKPCRNTSYQSSTCSRAPHARWLLTLPVPMSLPALPCGSQGPLTNESHSSPICLNKLGSSMPLGMVADEKGLHGKHLPIAQKCL